MDNFLREGGIGALFEIGKQSCSDLFDLLHSQVGLLELANRRDKYTRILADHAACKAAKRPEHTTTRPDHNSVLLSKVRCADLR
jgi:hypothetical protein